MYCKKKKHRNVSGC